MCWPYCCRSHRLIYSCNIFNEAAQNIPLYLSPEEKKNRVKNTTAGSNSKSSSGINSTNRNPSPSLSFRLLRATFQMAPGSFLLSLSTCVSPDWVTLQMSMLHHCEIWCFGAVQSGVEWRVSESSAQRGRHIRRWRDQICTIWRSRIYGFSQNCFSHCGD